MFWGHGMLGPRIEVIRIIRAAQLDFSPELVDSVLFLGFKEAVAFGVGTIGQLNFHEPMNLNLFWFCFFRLVKKRDFIAFHVTPCCVLKQRTSSTRGHHWLRR